MRTASLLTVAALALSTGLPIAQAAAAPASSKSIVKTTCQDYAALDETFKPKFIYYAIGHSKKGDPVAIFDTEGIETVKPELDEYCKVNLTKSAYEHVIKTSMASEKKAREHAKEKAKK